MMLSIMYRPSNFNSKLEVRIVPGNKDFLRNVFGGVFEESIQFVSPS